MEDWQKNLIEIVETVADDVENFLLEIADALESFALVSEQVAQQLQNTFSGDIEQLFSSIVDPLLELDSGLDDEIGFDSGWEVVEEESLFAKHPACAGCRHLHGQIYGGNLLICGMHPYGWEGNNCPDWESGETIDNDFNSPF
ncbi:MAG TPA: hypothetical protein V6D28_03515 [Leptolyngbyaceae cyanobacterium]